MTPRELGLPEKFSQWRPGQQEAYELLSKDPRRFQVAQIPVGSGKSLTAMALALAAAKEGKYATYLTATLHLQHQLNADFSEIGLMDVRGMSHYSCVAEGGTCDEGSCTEGTACWAKTSGCSYFDAVKIANLSHLRVTNYAFRMSQNPFQDALGNTDLLICDEAHSLAESVLSFLRVELNDREVHIPSDAELWDQAQWAVWARVAIVGVSQQMKKGMPRWKKKKLDSLKKKLLTLSTIPESTTPWVIDKVWNGWSFEPLWPAAYLESHLWRGVKKIILMSATITKSQLVQLGVTDYHFLSQESPIPTSQRPIIYWPVADLLGRRVTEMELWKMMEAVDEIIGARLDRRGIIHAVSFDRAKFILANSQWRELMIDHGSREGAEAVARFKASDPPCILVSPSVTTGADFDEDAARYQIIVKVPFIPPSALLKARTKEAKSYPYEMALKTIEQMSGRVARGPEDRGETIILDKSFGWLMRGRGAFTTKSFQRAVREVDAPPPPIVLLK